MRCPTCEATPGWAPDEAADRPQQKPCADCGGSGIAHCCEGERPDLVIEQREWGPNGR